MIRLDSVTKSFQPSGRNRSATLALEKFSLDVPDGEFLTIVGPSGCGKSTVLGLVAGFERPTSGQVLLDERPIFGPGSDRVVVFQEPGLYPWLDVRENIAFGLRLRGGRVNWDEVHAFVEKVGLDGFERHYPNELSGGMQQRVAIARALIVAPEVLLMDEPFGALDAQTRLTMQELLLSLWGTIKTTVIFITHDVDEAILLGDRVIVMTRRPGRTADTLVVPFGRPRHVDTSLTPEFIEMKRRILGQLLH